MPDSQNPDHVKKLIHEFQLKGANLIPTVTGEIVPTVLVADLTSDDRSSDDRITWGGHNAAASGAGNQNAIRFINPLGSNTLVIFETFVIHNTAATDIVDFEIITSSAGGTQQSFRDTRLQGRPSCQITVATAAAVALTSRQITIGTITQQFDLALNLGPGEYLRIRQLNQNEPLYAGSLWRERTLPPTAG